MDLGQVRLLALPVALMHPELEGRVDLSVIHRILDERLSKRGGFNPEIRRALTNILSTFSRPDVWSMSVSKMNSELGNVSFINADGRVVNAAVSAGQPIGLVPAPIVEALAILVISEMGWNIPPRESRTGVVPLDNHRSVRWVVHRPIYGGEDYYFIAARKVVMNRLMTMEDLVRSGMIRPEGVEIIRQHLERSWRIFCVVTGAPAAGKTTLLNAILQDFYKMRPDFYYVFYGDALDNPTPANYAILSPTSFENDIGVINRANSLSTIIGEITTAESANVAIGIMRVMANIFTTIHAQRVPDGVGLQVAALAGRPELASDINQNLSLVIHVVAFPHPKERRTIRVVREIWVRENPDDEIRCRYRIRMASTDSSKAPVLVGGEA